MHPDASALPNYELYLLMLNKCGRVLLCSADSNVVLPLSMWPTVLSQVEDQLVKLRDYLGPARRNEIAASVIYSLLQGPGLPFSP
jgi:hypothetical protein